MTYLLGVVLMTASLLLVRVSGASAAGPSAPHWLRAAVHGPYMALATAGAFGIGVMFLVQAAGERGGATGLALAGAAFVVPFLLLRLLGRHLLPAGGAIAGTPDLPPASPERPRRGRTGERPADAAEPAPRARGAG